MSEHFSPFGQIQMIRLKHILDAHRFFTTFTEDAWHAGQVESKDIAYRSGSDSLRTQSQAER